MSLTSAGYGQRKIKGKHHLAHRLAYEEAHGPIPTGMVVRHTCDVKACVNPEHLIIGSYSDNALDAVERGLHGMTRRTTCVNGHEFDGHDGRQRTCSTCARDRRRAHETRRRVG
ncbi:MAG: HNH endonuclease signature motif containing protein [Azonexus sp.]